MGHLKHRLARLALTALVATSAAMAGCSDDDRGESVDPAAAAGELRVELAGSGSPGTVYRLKTAQLVVTGPTSSTFGVEQPMLMQSLPVGDYRVELLPGWVLERQEGADYREVMAELTSPNPAEFSIVQGQTTVVTYRFRTNDVPGEGDLNVRVGVADGDETRTCSVEPDYGDLGALAVVPIADERSRGVSAAIGDPASGDQLSIWLRAERGVFTGGPIRPGTYTLTGDELDFTTCGVCVVLHGDRDPTTGVPRESYLATGGTVTITSADRLSGSLTNVRFEAAAPPSTPDAPTEVPPDAPAAGEGGGACATSIASATFAVPR